MPDLAVVPTNGGGQTNVLCFETVQQAFSNAASAVSEAAKSVFSALSELQLEPNSLARVLKLGENLFTTIELGTGKTDYFSSYTSVSQTTRSVIDCMQIFDSVGYFIGDRVKEDSWFGVVGNGVMCVGTVGSIISFMDELKVVDLSAIAQALGSIPVLGAVFRVGIAFEQVVTSVFIIGFALFGADAIGKLVDDEETPLQKRQAWIDLAWNVAEIGAAVFFICAGTQIIGMVVLGTIASALGLVAFLHRVWVQRQEEQLNQETNSRELVGETVWRPV